MIRVFTIHPEHRVLRIVVPRKCEVVMNSGGDLLVDQIMIDIQLPKKE